MCPIFEYGYRDFRSSSQDLLIKTDGFTYRGFKVDAIDRALYIDDLGEQAFKLSQKSGELRNKTGLYILGRDAELGLNTKEIQKLLRTGALTNKDVETAKGLYRDCQARAQGKEGYAPRGHVHRNLAILDPNATIPGNRKPGEGYIVAHFFENTGGYDENGDIIELDGVESTETKLWVPQTGIVVPTRYGMFNHLGLPEETLPDTKENREIAKQRLAEAGLPESELMNFYRLVIGSAVVWSESSPGGGALYVLLGWPARSYGRLGSFPASGSLSDRQGGLGTHLFRKKLHQKE